MDSWRAAIQNERGFTLIELLVVILIVGILAAIAIPSFLNQQSKASDVGAKELAHTAQVAIETCGIDNGGSYTNCNTAAILQSYEATIQTATGGGDAYILAPTIATGGHGYTVTAVSTNGDTFSITRSSTGPLSRACIAATGTVNTGCPAARTW